MNTETVVGGETVQRGWSLSKGGARSGTMRFGQRAKVRDHKKLFDRLPLLSKERRAPRRETEARQSWLEECSKTTRPRVTRNAEENLYRTQPGTRTPDKGDHDAPERDSPRTTRSRKPRK